MIEMPQDSTLIKHTIFHMEGIPNTLMIDFLIQSHSRKFKFTKDIPLKYISPIENFYKVSSVKDIENGMKTARNLVFQIITEIEN